MSSFFGFGDDSFEKYHQQMLKQSDKDALQSDWAAIGKDFSTVIEKKKYKM